MGCYATCVVRGLFVVRLASTTAPRRRKGGDSWVERAIIQFEPGSNNFDRLHLRDTEGSSTIVVCREGNGHFLSNVPVGHKLNHGRWLSGPNRGRQDRRRRFVSEPTICAKTFLRVLARGHSMQGQTHAKWSRARTLPTRAPHKVIPPRRESKVTPQPPHPCGFDLRASRPSIQVGSAPCLTRNGWEHFPKCAE